jgi:hypothetical protein
MAFITIWRSGALECMLVLNGEVVLLRLSDGISVLKEMKVTSTEEAMRTAEIWEAEARRSAQAVPLVALVTPPRGIAPPSGVLRSSLSSAS